MKDMASLAVYNLIIIVGIVKKIGTTVSSNLCEAAFELMYILCDENYAYQNNERTEEEIESLIPENVIPHEEISVLISTEKAKPKLKNREFRIDVEDWDDLTGSN
jgi:hypothetical protein